MFKLPELTYDYGALEPYIDVQTMHIHHDKHHAGYVDKLNKALEGHDDILSMSVEDLMRDLDKVPQGVRTAVQNNGGGHANHSLFWTVMGPSVKEAPEGELMEAVKSAFGGLEEFKTKFSEAAVGRFGSGWAWLVAGDGGLEVIDTPNQDSPLMQGKTPILGLDVWEHAYYLKYQNKRPDYISAWWSVVNWDAVEKLFAETKS